jgi:hypothetical protein
MEEKWKKIKGFPNHKISDMGNVWTPYGGGKLKKLQPDRKGYLRTQLMYRRKNRTARVSHLVLEAFVGPRPKGKECNHINGIKTDNRLGNLEWVTPSENARHAVETGLRPGPKGELNQAAKLTNEQVLELRNLYCTTVIPTRNLATMFGIRMGHLNKIVNHKCWAHVKDNYTIPDYRRGTGIRRRG